MGGGERGTRQERSRDQYDVRRKERGERTQKWKGPAISKKKRDCQFTVRPLDAGGGAPHNPGSGSESERCHKLATNHHHACG